MKVILFIGWVLLQSVAAIIVSANGAAAGAPLPAPNETEGRIVQATLLAGVRSGPSAPAQNHALIKGAVTAFVQQQTASLPGKVAYKVDDIDPRITLPECAKLEAFLPSGSQFIGKVPVGVRCNELNGWNIFVPVQIKISLKLLTSARQLPLGHTLQEADLSTQTSETIHAAGITDPVQVIGKVLRYGITAGQILREDMLRPPYSMVQGQIVQIAARGNGFSIGSEGVALNNASEGQAVQIRVASGRVISGIARSNGKAEISPR